MRARLSADGLLVPAALDGVLGLFRPGLHQGQGRRRHAARQLLIYASTDTAWARIHSLIDMPMFTAGRAGGRVKTGLHIDGAGAGHALGYTAMKLFGLDVDSWGTKSNTTEGSRRFWSAGLGLRLRRRMRHR